MAKAEPKKMTLEKLALMSQGEFLAIRSEMATKSQLGEVGNELKEDVKILRQDVEAGFVGISESMKTILEKLNQIQQDVIEIHDLRSRVERLEKKVGLPR